RGGQMSVHAVVLGTALVAENTASVLCLHVHYTVAFPHSLGTVCGTQCPLSEPPHSHTHTHTHTHTYTHTHTLYVHTYMFTHTHTHTHTNTYTKLTKKPRPATTKAGNQS